MNVDYNMKAAGRVIHRLRMKKELSQEVLSGFAVLSRSHLSEIERGKRTIQLDTLWKVAHALEIRPSELVKMIEEEMEDERI